MAKNSNIQWTDATWNLARGCTKVNSDCIYCYIYRESYGKSRYDPFQVVRTKGAFNLPLTLKEPQKVFTSSLTDFFHIKIDSYRDEAWEIIRNCPQHTFQILTKRPERILEHLPEFWDEIKHHVWLGTSVGSQNSIQMIMTLVNMGLADANLFLSLEPLHGEITLPQKELQKIGWVILGGESGNESGKCR